MTPFRTQNVPPPMCSYQLSLPSTPVHVSFSASQDAAAILVSDGTIQVWNLCTRLPTSKQRGVKVAEPALIWTFKVDLASSWWIPKQVCFGENRVACVLQSKDAEPCSRVVWAESGKHVDEEDLDHDIERLVWSKGSEWLILDQTGLLRPIGSSGEALDLNLPPQPLALSVVNDVVIHLSSNGKLIAGSTKTGTIHPLASGVTSFTHSPEFLIYTTASQKSHYVPFVTLQRVLQSDDVEDWEMQWETRAIERGALAVTACQSSMSLVLQMPRGNLETVYPRPLVLSVVRRKVMR